MDLQIRNFGAIENADVKFDGLTVIAGENDTGKSTVGKLVFAVIKAISRYEQDLEMSKEQNTIRAIDSLYRKLRNSVDNFGDLKREFNTYSFIRQLRPFAATNQLSLFQESPDNGGIDFVFDRKKSILQNAAILSDEAKYSKEDLIVALDKIKSEILKKDNKSEVIKRALTRAFASEFHLEFTPKNTNKKTFLNFTEHDYKLFTIKAGKNKITDFLINDEVLPFEDVSFIESGIVLQLHDAIKKAETLFEEVDVRERWSRGHGVSLHVKDIVNKIREANIFISSNTYGSKQAELLREIQEVIGGKWIYHEEKVDFIFSKKSKNIEQNFRSNNTASGIKSFGIIQLLLLAEILNNRSLLIIDEPETHLHPKWQVEYAKIICLLVKHEIPVLLTSHSPYLIEALRYYSKEYDIERFTNYYLAERNENGLVDIENVNDEMNRVFLKLSEPFQKLVWEA